MEEVRWRECVSYVNSNMESAVGSLYIKQAFTKDSKEMVCNLGSNGHCPGQPSSSPWDSLLARVPPHHHHPTRWLPFVAISTPISSPDSVTPRGTCINTSAYQNRGRSRETLPPGAPDHELQPWTLLGPWERHRLYVWVLSPWQASLQPTCEAPTLSQISHPTSMPHPSQEGRGGAALASS